MEGETLRLKEMRNRHFNFTKDIWMVNKLMKICSTSFIGTANENHNEIPLSTEWLKLQAENIRWWGCGPTGTLILFAGV